MQRELKQQRMEIRKYTCRQIIFYLDYKRRVILLKIIEGPYM